jgi:hypothetical protein
MKGHCYLSPNFVKTCGLCFAFLNVQVKLSCRQVKTSAQFVHYKQVAKVNISTPLVPHQFLNGLLHDMNMIIDIYFNYSHAVIPHAGRTHHDDSKWSNLPGCRSSSNCSLYTWSRFKTREKNTPKKKRINALTKVFIIGLIIIDNAEKKRKTL